MEQTQTTQPERPNPPTRKTANLSLLHTKALPRLLQIDWFGRTCTAHVFMCEPIRSVAFGVTSEIAEARLVLRFGKPVLWLGRAAFDLTPEEALLVRATFEPLGLAIEEELAPLGAGPLEPEVAPQTDESDLDDDERRWRSGDRRSDSERAHDDAGVTRLFR